MRPIVAAALLLLVPLIASPALAGASTPTAPCPLRMPADTSLLPIAAAATVDR